MSAVRRDAHAVSGSRRETASAARRRAAAAASSAATEPGDGWNVARYLIARFEQLGVRFLFGVPGNHLGPFLEVLAAERGAGRADTPMTGLAVRDDAELDALLQRLADRKDAINRGPVLVQVVLARTDYPEAIGYAIEPCHVLSVEVGKPPTE